MHNATIITFFSLQFFKWITYVMNSLSFFKLIYLILSIYFLFFKTGFYAEITNNRCITILHAYFDLNLSIYFDDFSIFYAIAIVYDPKLSSY